MTKRHPGQFVALLAIPCLPCMAALLWYDQAESLVSDHEKEKRQGKIKPNKLFDLKIIHEQCLHKAE